MKYINIVYYIFVFLFLRTSFAIGEDFPVELYMPAIIGGSVNKTGGCEEIIGCYKGNFSDNCPGSTYSGVMNLIVNKNCSFVSLSNYGVEARGSISKNDDSTYSGIGRTGSNGCGSFSINCKILNSSIYCNYKYDNGKSGTISKATPVICKQLNRIKTEYLAGSWTFTYKIISTWSSYFNLDINSVEESISFKGYYDIFGYDQWGDPVVAGYSTALNQYTLLDPGILMDEFFVFNFSGNGIVKGCYYQVDHYDQSFSNCYIMNGVLTGKSSIGKKYTDSRSSDVENDKINEKNSIEKSKLKIIESDKTKEIFDQYQKSKNSLSNRS